jgi:hypothetical protein
LFGLYLYFGIEVCVAFMSHQVITNGGQYLNYSAAEL